MGGGPNTKISTGLARPGRGAAMLGPSPAQATALVMGGAALTCAVITAPDIVAAVTVIAIQLGFLTCAIWRIGLVLLSRQPPPAPAAPTVWPRYTLLIALHDEAAVISQLIERLAQIDYPDDRLEAFLLIEAHDQETLEAIGRIDLPAWMAVEVVPPGRPGTKPRALNHGLGLATGDLVAIYDAEDDPDPLQLREAAARFMADPEGDLVCVQAPLRIRRKYRTAHATPFLDRQFTVEYAALFEVTLPAMAQLGLPFPLGGTSNHFRVEALRAVGGWDAYNVTEDADLGFRIWRNGGRLGMIARPTYETPPGGVETWLPQRTRWLKGYMQTWGVHTRTYRGLGWKGLVALIMTLGASLAAASAHAATLAWVAASILVSMAAGLPPGLPVFALSVLTLGVAAAWIQGAIGARRAHTPYSAADMMMAPAYWCLLSLAFAHAVWRLIFEPHVWDKTAHLPDVEPGKAIAPLTVEA